MYVLVPTHFKFTPPRRPLHSLGSLSAKQGGESSRHPAYPTLNNDSQGLSARPTVRLSYYENRQNSSNLQSDKERKEGQFGVPSSQINLHTQPPTSPGHDWLCARFVTL